ncbi:AAA family ATPase [Caenispirillum bisanense]|uniref:AAA domain-containing protein n=1 Tax=Caenispirillum bisanense TaxID=414052 RepID=A0A286GYL2_9PROT|nr:ATP-binding protein [Caenispirillum bisanense]SOE00610.1 AAA domain-containing protein [Caenispirillum bisanense]
MTQTSLTVNAPAASGGTIAPLTNVALFADMLTRLIERPAHLPGIGVFHGFSGYGKTWSARYGANKRRAFYLECGESWTKLKFLRSLLIEMGRKPRGTAADMMEEAISALAMTGRPLIVDEGDQIVKRGYIEAIRELHDQSGAPIALIGEEGLPDMIARASERTHNRVLVWQPAQPASVDDAHVLAQLFHADVEISAGLMAALVKASGGRPRRMVVNLYNIAAEAAVNGWGAVDEAAWGDRGFYTGQTPARRVG